MSQDPTKNVNPVNVPKTRIIAKASAKRMMPIKAFIIRLLAEAIFSLSPPDIIHSNAPQRSIKIKAIPATEKIRVTRLDKNWLIAPDPVGFFSKNGAIAGGGLIVPNLHSTLGSSETHGGLGAAKEVDALIK